MGRSLIFVDACAIIALLSDEPEAERISQALAAASDRVTSPVAVLEVVLGLARADKFAMTPAAVEPLVLHFLEARDIKILDLPPAPETVALSVRAADRYRTGRHRLNIGDCLHYACAKYYRIPVLATADEFRQTDLDTIP